jgi:hypothetical protein
MAQSRLHITVPQSTHAIDKIELNGKLFPPGRYVLMSDETAVCDNNHCPWFDITIPESILAPDLLREAHHDLGKLPNLWIDSTDIALDTTIQLPMVFYTQPRDINYVRHFSVTPTSPASPHIPPATESETKKLGMRVLKPEAFERLEVCVNTPFAPSRIALREGFPKGHSYRLMFQDTLICKSDKHREFNLPTRIKQSGRDLLSSVNWDLRNLEEGGLWIDCEPHAFICKKSNTGRFYFHRYGLEFFGDKDGQSRFRIFYPHLTCKFDLGSVHTLSLQFSHDITWLHWKRPENVDAMCDHRSEHRRTLLFWHPKDHKAKMDTLDDFVTACTLACPQRLWVEAYNEEDMLPDNFACTQVYVE